jgi:hypothetical protein
MGQNEDVLYTSILENIKISKKIYLKFKLFKYIYLKLHGGPQPS